jgi:NAD(P)-dependent dehydrogenase (short-subunit alcohol dehydrogenase family)
MARLNGKVAAVTGGASGIGEATVRRFVTEGAKVVFADRDAERGKRVAADITASGGDVVFVEAHMQREAEAAAFVRQAAERFGRLDILVNNAGVRLYHTVEDATSESWDEILGVNLKGYAFCAKAAIPLLRQAAPSSIVNVASVRSVTSIGRTTQYDTTKAAVAGLTRGMAADHAADGIRVNAVSSGRSTRHFTRTAIDRSAGRSSSIRMTPPRARFSGVTARRRKSPRASCFSRPTTRPT